MYVRSLYLRNFRIYQEASFEFSPHSNMIWGANAQGKTTILEAIHLIITGRSFRTTQLADLIRHGADFFHLEASFVKHGIEQTLRISCKGKEKKIVHNSTVCQSFASLLGLLQGVVITPDDASLVKSGPAVRRQFLDMQIAQVDPLYVHHLMRYHKALRQRNALLRAKTSATIESWEHEMANSAAYVAQQRFSTIEGLQKSCSRIHSMLTGVNEDLGLKYKTGAPVSEDLKTLQRYYLERYQKHRSRELMLGFTLTGPHKDDLLIMIRGQEARHFASEGQQRSCVTALHMSEWERLKALGNELPLMLIDDVGISLDKSRKERLLAHLNGLEQVFLTATENLHVEKCYSINIRPNGVTPKQNLPS